VTTVNVFDQLANVALVARKCPSTTMRRAYVKAMRDWCAETRWLRIAITGATVADQQQYDLGSDTYTEIIAIYAMQVTIPTAVEQTLPVYPGNPGAWNPNLQTGIPTQYAYIPEGKFALWQIPDDVYSLNVVVAIQPKAEVTQIPSEPLKKYSTAFEAGALMHLLRLPGQPWTNPEMASKVYEPIWNSAISNAKAEVARNFNSGSQRVKPRAFVTGR
jgi:hypothetical protein